MSATSNQGSEAELRRLIPLNTLTPQRFRSLCEELQPETVEPGTFLFREGEPATDWVYVLSGSVALMAGKIETEVIVGGSDFSRIALAHQTPRKVSAVAKDRVCFVRVRPERFNRAAAGATDAKGYEVRDGADGAERTGDWMSALLRSPIFLRLPPAHLQTLLRTLREVSAEAGEVICRQDEPGEFFHILRSGQCVATRRPRPGAKSIRLGTLRPWDSFGEDALISGEPHAETVTMETDGELLRLDKASFLTLIRDPLVSYVDAAEALKLMDNNGVWLDLRLPDRAFELQLRRDCRNVPFFSLRTMLANLDRHRAHVCVCEDGGIAAAAAFVLLKSRIPAFVLRGGVGSLPADETLANPRQELKPAPADTGQWGLVPDLSQAELGAFDAGLETPPPPPLAIAGEPAPNADVGDGAAVPAAIERLSEAIAALFAGRQRLAAALAAAGLPQPAADEWPERSAVTADLAGIGEALRNAMVAAEEKCRETENLQEYVADLKALVEQFLEDGGRSLGEEVTALRSELDIVRGQAGTELATLQKRLLATEAENQRLKTSLEATQTQASLRERLAEAELPAGPRPRAWPSILAGCVLGVLLSLGGLLGLEAGRDYLRGWLLGPAGVENAGGAPPPPAAPATPPLAPASSPRPAH